MLSNIAYLHLSVSFVQMLKVSRHSRKTLMSGVYSHPHTHHPAHRWARAVQSISPCLDIPHVCWVFCRGKWRDKRIGVRLHMSDSGDCGE